MKLIISCTNRKKALSLELSYFIKSIYENHSDSTELLDLKNVNFKELVEAPYSLSNPSPLLKEQLEKIAQASALILVCPEYNGGFPGLIKHFIDHWIYPDSFVYKPVCFVGLGGRFGALNPILQLEKIFLYRHSFVFPLRVFIQKAPEVIKEGKVQDKHIVQLLEKQAKNFIKFTKSLQSEKFD